MTYVRASCKFTIIMENSVASAIRNGDEGHPMVKRRKEEYGEKSRDQMCLPLELDQQN